MSDYNFLMESRLSPEQLQILNFLGRLAAIQGLNFYLVGGAVRDLVQGQQPIRDLDFVVQGNPQKILRHLDYGLPSALPASETRSLAPEPVSPGVEHVILDKRWNAAEVRFKNGVHAEIAASRNEIYHKPGRPPEIVPAMIFDDLKRRDFSADALAISLHPNSRGLLLDPTNGSADLAQRELRVLHSHSFAEDPSRIYRLLRLCLRLDFKPEERTRQLLESAIEDRVWEHTDPERQGRELRAILEEENPGRVLKVLVDRGLLGGLDKKLASARIAYDRFAKVRAAARSLPRADALLLNFHCLVEKLGGAHQDRLARKILRHPATVKAALSLERDARQLARTLSGPKGARNSYLYAVLAAAPQHLLLFLLAFYREARVQSRVKAFLFKFPQLRAKLPRAELQAMGMPPGPKFEKIIEQVFLDQLDGKIRSQSQTTAALRALSGIKEKPTQPAKPSAPTGKAHGSQRKTTSKRKG